MINYSGQALDGLRVLHPQIRDHTNRRPASCRALQGDELHIVGVGELGEGVWGGFLEAGDTAAEDEADFVGGAVALFSEEEFGLVAFFGSGVEFEEIGAVDEHDHVGVLFDGAGFAEVGELRAAFFAFGSAGQLAKHQNGNLQFLGKTLERAGNAGDFFLTIAEAAARGNELEIVNDEQRKTLVALEAAGFGADFENADGTGVVNPQGRGGNGAEGIGHAAPVFAVEVAGAEFVPVDLRHGRNETLEQGLFGHFQTEHGDGQTGTHGDIFGEVEGQGGLPLRRASGGNQQFGILQTGSEFIELGIAGGNPGNAFAFLEDTFEALEIVANDIFDGQKAGANAVFG